MLMAENVWNLSSKRQPYWSAEEGCGHVVRSSRCSCAGHGLPLQLCVTWGGGVCKVQIISVTVSGWQAKWRADSEVLSRPSGSFLQFVVFSPSIQWKWDWCVVWQGQRSAHSYGSVLCQCLFLRSALAKSISIIPMRPVPTCNLLGFYSEHKAWPTWKWGLSCICVPTGRKSILSLSGKQASS